MQLFGAGNFGRFWRPNPGPGLDLKAGKPQPEGLRVAHRRKRWRAVADRLRLIPAEPSPPPPAKPPRKKPGPRLPGAPRKKPKP